MRRSIAERRDALEHRGDELAGELPGIAAPGPVHAATIEVLTDLMSMSERLSTTETPTHLRVVMRTLQRSRPLLLEGIANIPPAAIQEFMREMIARMQRIVDAREDGASDHESTGAADARSNIA